MKFDDRLATILAVRATDEHDRAVRWRQLVDLVARSGPDAHGPIVAEALSEIRAGRNEVGIALRSAAARAIAGRTLPLALLELFASDALEVAAPLLTGIAPSERLAAAASPDVRRFLEAMHPALRPAPEVEAIVPSPPAPPAASPQVPSRQTPSKAPLSIREAVERIESLRSRRDAMTPPPPVIAPPPPVSAPPPPVIAPPPGVVTSPEVAAPTPASPPPPPQPPRRAAPLPTPAAMSELGPESPALFRWECGPGGNIGWVEGAPRGPLIGRSIARAEDGEGVDRDVERAFARRAPFRDATLALPEAGIVAGRWLISGVPAFAPDDGRFVGYRGIARRAETLRPEAMVSAPPAALDAAALRELVHEIKTPLNAIIGFAEIIDGQYLGPAQSGYRARAAEIVGQARVLLGAIDDLDFAARLRARPPEDSAKTDFADFFPPFAEWFSAEAKARGVALAIDSPPSNGLCMLDRELSERLLDRFAIAVLSAATPAETLRLAVRQEDGFCALRLSRPRALEGLSDGVLFGSQGISDSDISLRLVVGLAQIVGARLEADGGDLVLTMPTES